MIKRTIFNSIAAKLNSNKVIVILGARRVGKTVLLKQLQKEYTGLSLLLNGEDLDDAERLATMRKSMYDVWLKNIDLLLIDEAQNIENIGKILKLLIDSYPQLTIIVTGSSAFKIHQQAGEPLVGRQIIYHLFPFSESEIHGFYGSVEADRSLPTRLVYGSYPEPYKMDDFEDRKDYLRAMVSAYLIKDILSYEYIRHSGKMIKLLKLVAYQIGQEVSYDELANALQIDRNTVEKYLDLFSKIFVIFRLGGYSKNLRKEVTKSSKWYFTDIGLRNALINDFRPIEIRQDKGQIWENYFISEKRKSNLDNRFHKELFFWRTYDKQEIDLVETDENELAAYEVKYQVKKNYLFPKAFRKAYPDAKYHLITPKNYLPGLNG